MECIPVVKHIDAEGGIGLYGTTFRFPERGPAVLVTGALHGDEVTSTGAIWYLARKLQDRVLTGSVTVIPCVNQLAVRASSRLVPLEDTDLNRHFPGRNDGSLAERLAYGLIELLESHDALVDVHTAGWCTSYVLVDEIPHLDLRARVVSWAHASGLPVVGEMPAEHLALQGLDRSFSAWGSIQMQKPSLTVELPGFHTLESRQARNGAEVLLRLLQSLPRLQEPSPEARPPLSRHEIFASAGGLFEAQANLGQSLADGDQIGILHALDGASARSITADRPGVLLALQPVSAVHVGSWLATVAVE